MAKNIPARALLRLIQLSSNIATLAACRLVRLTGKSRRAVHPKLLINHPAVIWYIGRVRRGDRLLDLGAGVGIHAARCASSGASVVAADISSRNLDKVRDLAAGAGVRLVRCDATKRLPFRDGSFTGVLLLDVLEHLDDPETALAESVRVLRPGGWVAISLPNSQTTWKRRYRRAGLPWMSDRDHKREYTWPEIEQLLDRAGLRLESGPDAVALDTPLTGWIDLVGAFSLGLYRRLTEWRVARAAKRPEESTGFRCIAVKP